MAVCVGGLYFIWTEIRPARYGDIKHYGVFLRNGTRWVELERRTPNLNYGNAFLSDDRAFDGVTVETGPEIQPGSTRGSSLTDTRVRSTTGGPVNESVGLELVLFGAEECAGIGQYQIKFVDRVGDVSPPQPNTRWVVSTRHVADLRRGPVEGHPDMCRLYLESGSPLSEGQYYVPTRLGYYFFRVGSASAAPSSPPASNPAARPASGTLTIQPGPAQGNDIWTTSVYSFAPGGGGPGGGANDGSLKVGGWGDEYDSLLQFDLSNAPRSPTSAVLELYCYSSNNAQTTAMWLDRINSPWDWRNSGTGRDRARLWWADRPSSERWRTEPLPPPSVGAWYRIELTDLVSAWIDGRVPNHGIQLRPVNTSNAFNYFHSSDNVTDPALRPRLILRY